MAGSDDDGARSEREDRDGREARDARDGREVRDVREVRDGRREEREGDSLTETIRQRLETLVPDLVKKTFAAGMGAVFQTEEGIRRIARENLPEVAGYIASSADNAKDKVFDVIARETREFLSGLNVSEEIAKILTTLSFEIKTEIRFIPNSERFTGAEPDVKASVRLKRTDRPDRPERPERPERADRADRADRPGERGERADRVDRPDRPERVDRPERDDEDEPGRSGLSRLRFWQRDRDRDRDRSGADHAPGEDREADDSDGER